MADGSICYALVRKVAAERGVDSDSLAPLHTAIDPDALESMFDSSNGSRLRNGHVSFEYEGFTVSVDHEETVSLTSSADDE
ncbi:HalOD1 output domain-containing protein [Halorientalis sp.]|uniref:HalOD1 output domain-containing protein n=1 Tax=Halorientalis sp. TaxID=1931229 RepID=UPI00262FE18A|nr:HalOD1 output domain-containing protein [Halorientalis sp.]